MRMPSRHGFAASDGIGDDRLTLGPYYTFLARRSPRGLLQLLSYYKFAAKMIGPGKRVLDVGCSEGFGTMLFAEFADACLGVDQDAEAIAIASDSVATERLAFEVGDILAGDIGRFDAVVGLNVIEHIPRENEEGFMAVAATALEEDGIFVVGTPNVSAEKLAGEPLRAAHLNLFDAERLHDLAQRHFSNVFSFSANDEVVHTGFAPLAQYLIAVCVGPLR